MSVQDLHPNKLLGVWGSASADVWAVAAVSILHWDGSIWSIAESGPINFFGVGGVGTDVWVVGQAGTILHH